MLCRALSCVLRSPRLALWIAAFLALAVPRSALAHPMGTMSTNRSALLLVRAGETRVRYAVDFAEVPSVAEKARYDAEGAAPYAAARGAELSPQLHLSLDGAPMALAVDRCFANLGPGEGGLTVVSLLCDLRAAAVAHGRIVLEDDNFANTVGWRELRVVGDGVDVGAGDPPGAVWLGSAPLPFSTPPEQMVLARVAATVGTRDAGAAEVAAGSVATKAPDRLAALVAGQELSPTFVLLALLSALVLGAGHALSPGHGKTVVAAYLVGSRGTVSQALLLGLTVTATHVSSVLLLGAVTLWLSEYVVAAALYPWIGVASGFGVVLVGSGLLRSRLATWRAKKRASEGAMASLVSGHDHGHDHGYAVAPGHVGLPSVPAPDSWLEHDHGPGGHAHIHHDDAGEPVSLGRLLLLGLNGGAVPCPSALVVLLAAIALHRVAFGMLLIVSFSVGLAGVLMAIGVLVVRAQRLLARFEGAGRAAVWLPIGSAVVVIGLGMGIAVQSAREGGLLHF